MNELEEEQFLEIIEIEQGKNDDNFSTNHVLTLLPNFKKISFLEICKIAVFQQWQVASCPCPACNKDIRHLFILLINKERIIKKLEENPEFKTYYDTYHLGDQKIKVNDAIRLQGEIVATEWKSFFDEARKIKN